LDKQIRPGPGGDRLEPELWAADNLALLLRRPALWALAIGLLCWFLAAACSRKPENATLLPPATPPPSSTVSPSAPVTTLPGAVIEQDPTGEYPYPPPADLVVEPSATPNAYPGPTERPSPAVTSPPFTSLTPAVQSFIPYISRPQPPTPTPTPTPLPTPTPTIDFAAVRARLQAQGQELGFVKIGFHTAVGGNRRGLGEWLTRLDQAGVPFFLKSADDAGPLFEAQEIVRQSDTPHVLVYRRSGDEYDTPDYNLAPQEAAIRHWQLHKEAFPPELDPSIVWLETINEVDKGRSVWLAEFAQETARLALADGFRWAAFGWSSGEPEPADWESRAMLVFLRQAAANPDRLAIALHEYSFDIDNIGDQYPFKVGRFHQLFQAVDRHGIPRPTVLITEWGWEYGAVPSIDNALEDVAWAARMYAQYPEIKGAAIWYLGGGFSDIAERVQPLIAPLTEYALGNYFPILKPPARAPADPALYRP